MALDAFVEARSLYAALLSRCAAMNASAADAMSVDYTLMARWQKQIDDLDPSIR